MNNLTQLPEKWAIQLDNDNIDILSDWRSDGRINNPTNYYGFWLHTPMYERNGYNQIHLDGNYTPITFDQFKEWVLNETPIIKENYQIY